MTDPTIPATAWTALIGSAPAAVAVIATTWKFLGFIKEMEEDRVKGDQQRSEALKSLGDKCHGFQMEMSKRNAETAQVLADAYERNTHALEKAVAALAYCNTGAS